MYMKKLSKLVEKVLGFIEPDPSNWNQWVEDKELENVSQADCMQQFVGEMTKAKDNNLKVIVAGDYDCDGIIATSIMVDGLRRFGIDCGFYIPNRIKEGYGLHPHTVDLAYKKEYSYIVTVDNGVKAKDALERAKELGMYTIVTDHHRIEKNVCCDILVHPTTLEDCFSTLCGAGIAYECVRALGVDTSYHLQLAAVASVGDVMHVTKETRALIQKGLHELNQSRDQHLMPLANDYYLNEEGLGFQIVPKLNAVGRMSNLANVNNVVRYFLSEDDQEIVGLRQQLLEINDQRKRISDQMSKLALSKCQIQNSILMVCDESFHEGIIGLVAGSLCGSFNKPSIVLAKNEKGYKASMRSPNGFDCMEFLKGFDYYSAIGGHTQAAGFSINLQDYDAFECFVKTRIKEYSWEQKKKRTLIVSEDELGVEEIQSLDAIRPFGTGFEFPLFELKNPNIRSIFDIQKGKHRKITLQSGLQCMNFNQSLIDREKSVNQIESFIGKPQINEYKGRKSVTFVIESIVYKS